jgi:hypothetical protein
MNASLRRATLRYTRLATVIVILTAMSACKRASQVDGKMQGGAAVQPLQPQSAGTYIANATRTPMGESDPHCGLDAYPLPRSYEQLMADAPQNIRKPTALLEAKAAVGPDGNITHLRFTRLSSLEAINRRPVEFVTNQHYSPSILDGAPVSACTTISVNVDFR